ncbi:energy transducer TonB [Sphingomonas sp. RP10(2022)]|uniref:Energy transducer TonB n=1 Tax=Sphingomonas liriopis TaxID=2949094 RepID=A0A9X2I122_9SPHN|nr:energy transducer TonB [Sphingomonas liriopis]MCP3736535.1 energy transducer TonB [Sphingomonas liriopis]
MIDEEGEPRSHVLQADVRPTPQVRRRWSGNGRGLMIGIIGMLAVLLVALMVTAAWFAQRAFDAVENAGDTDHQAPPRTSNSMNPADWISQDDYPAEALRNNEQGTVRIAWSVTPAGRVHDCHVEQSSGHRSLDAAACRAITRNGLYPPTPANAPPRTFTRRVVWKIPEDGPAVSPGQLYVPGKPIDVATTHMDHFASEVAITVGYDGKVERCRVVAARPSVAGDPCLATPPGMAMGPGFVRNGKPIKAVLHRRMESRTTFE